MSPEREMSDVPRDAVPTEYGRRRSHEHEGDAREAQSRRERVVMGLRSALRHLSLFRDNDADTTSLEGAQGALVAENLRRWGSGDRDVDSVITHLFVYILARHIVYRRTHLFVYTRTRHIVESETQHFADTVRAQ